MMILTDDNHVSDLVLLVVGGAFVFALLGAIVAWLLFSRRPFA
jgi:hypothetical protein